MLILSTFSPEYLLNFWILSLLWNMYWRTNSRVFFSFNVFLQALGMKIVNIVLVKMLENAKMKMIAAVD